MYTIIYDMFIPSVPMIPYFHPSQLEDTGHQIIEMLNADRTLRIEMATWQQLAIFAPEIDGWTMRFSFGMAYFLRRTVSFGEVRFSGLC